MLSRQSRNRGARFAFALALVPALVLAAARPVRADETLDAARARYDQGERSFEAGRFLDAAADFEAAYKLTPRSDLLYDAARAFDKGGNAARAITLYEAYLRTGDHLPEEAQVKDRLDDLRTKVAFVLVRANLAGAKVFIDGEERGTTPMISAVPVGSGLHRVEVRSGEMAWRIEQEFANGLSHTVVAELFPPTPAVEIEKHNKRFVAVFGLGGVIDVTASNFPPSQAALLFGFEYRILEWRSFALDLSLRIPLEVGQNWTNSGLLPGVRVVLDLSQRVPLELVPSLDLGLSALHFGLGIPTPAINFQPQPCANPAPGQTTCNLYGLRIHPAINLVYHFLPDWEARAELFGLVADITSPVARPRVDFGLSLAWRFY